MSSHDLFAPAFKGEPYWWDAWRPQPLAIPDLPAKTDVAIIGGGYAGLSAALELARSGIGAVVFEANDFGFGASTRSGGMVSGGVTLGKGLGGKRGAGDAAARAALIERLLGDSVASFDHLEALLSRENIACHYRRTGRFTGAWSRRHYDGLAAKVAEINRIGGLGASMLPRERQREAIASDFYHGGMLIERAGQLHPSLYYKGLLDACRGRAIVLAPQTRVGRITGAPGAFTLVTSRGALSARDVVVATNGYTGDATPAFKRRLVPVASHIIATEPLEPALAASLIPGYRAISDTQRVLCYYRMSPDNTRLVFGGRARFTAVTPEVSAPILHRYMIRRFPQLDGVKLTHAWTGNVAFTFDFLPHMGRQDGLHYALGCNGSGVAMMSYLGHQVARKILGGGNRVSAFEDLDFPTQPGYRGNPWFLPLVGGYYRLRDRLDRVFDR